MHREILIKQFPIVTTHWWPKTRNERFVWENEQYLYRFLPLVHNHVQVIWVHTHIRCVTCVCDVCVRALCSSASTLDGGRVWSVVLTRRHKTTNHILLWCCMNGIGKRRKAPEVISRAYTSLIARARAHTRHTPRHTHTSHTGCVRTQITWTWLCTRGKKLLNTVCFLTQTARFVS